MAISKRLNPAAHVALSFLVLAMPCFSSGDALPSSIQTLLSKDSIYLYDLKRLPLDVKQGDGPVRYVLFGNAEVVFWYKPGFWCFIGPCRVRLVTMNAVNDENHGKILWPKDKIGQDFELTLKRLYAD